MRKIYLCFAAAAALLSVSCQKELEGGIQGGQVKTITKTVTVEGNEWLAGETKGEYTPGEGVKLTGEEPIAIYYADPDKKTTATEGDPYMVKATDVTKTADGKYTFVQADKGLTAYDYYFMIPDINTYGMNSQCTSNSLKVAPVQHPKANSFDPNYEILIGKAQLGIAPTEELTVTEFKRITTPFVLNITDEAGLLGGEKIHAVTAKFSQKFGTNTGLVGQFYISHSDVYEDCRLTSVNPASNAVTALYAEGLPKLGTEWPVWYMVNPVTFTGGELTVTVTTATKIIERTVTLTGEVSIKANALNRLKFNITGDGYTVISKDKEVVYTDFSTLAQGTLSAKQAVVSANGQPYFWGFENCLVNFDNYNQQLPNGLRMNQGKVTLPKVTGKWISKIYLYAHQQNKNNNNTISLNTDKATVAFGSNSPVTLIQDGGVAVISVPESEKANDLILSTTADWTSFAAMAFEFEPSGEDAPTADENDYYAQFNAGLDIEINGVKYNKSGWTARLKKVNELTVADLQADAMTYGILFIDETGQTEAKQLEFVIPGNITSAIWVGQHKNKQPIIKPANTENQTSSALKVRGNLICKNISFVTDNNYMFSSDGAYSGKNLSLQDCSIDVTKSRYMIYDVSKNATFGDVTIDNCVIEVSSTRTDNPAVFAVTTSDGKTVFLKSFTLTNSVVYAANTSQNYVCDFGGNNEKYAGQAMIVNVSGNTFYNLWQKNILIRGYKFGGLTVQKNLAYYSQSEVVTAKSPFVGSYTSFPDAVIENNYTSTDSYYHNIETNVGHQYCWTGIYNTANLTAGAGNSFRPTTTSAEIFTTVDAENGYFPVNTSTVTNGAGADYATKYWMNITK